VHEPVLLRHIWDTPLIVSEDDKVKVTKMDFVYISELLLIIIELFGGVVSRIMVSEQAVEVFPALSLNHTYTVFVPSPVVNVHAFDVAYASHDEHELVLLMHIWETLPELSEADNVKVTDRVFA
jgi:hypothetical protein